jgi:pimeloyl-ACP methyl ester carboxylesterase
MPAAFTFLYRAALSVLLAVCFALANGAFAQTPAAFHIDRAGDPDGGAVLFIPGLSSSGEVWAESAAQLGDYDVHAVTLAGFAGLPPVENPAFLPAMRDALIDHIETEELGPVAIAGHSLGGQLALQIAAERPDLVDRVLVVDSVPFFVGLFNPAATPEQAAAFAPMTAAQMANAPREAFLAQSRQGMAV